MRGSAARLLMSYILFFILAKWKSDIPFAMILRYSPSGSGLHKSPLSILFTSLVFGIKRPSPGFFCTKAKRWTIRFRQQQFSRLLSRRLKGGSITAG